MPAKKEYLSGPWKRFSKIMAAIPGAYLATMLMHVAIAKIVPDDTPVIMTTAYSAFFVWVGLMVIVYFIKKSWHAWSLLLLLMIISGVLIFI